MATPFVKSAYHLISIKFKFKIIKKVILIVQNAIWKMKLNQFKVSLKIWHCLIWVSQQVQLIFIQKKVQETLKVKWIANKESKIKKKHYVKITTKKLKLIVWKIKLFCVLIVFYLINTNLIKYIQCQKQ